MTKLHLIRKALKTGPRWYVYAWRGGPQIYVQDGPRPVVTPDLLSKAFAARQTGAADYAGSFNAIIDAYRNSPEFSRLAKVTQDDYKRWLTRISERFGTAPVEIMADYRMRRDILAWRDKWADQPRAADRAVGTLSVVLGWAARRGMIATNIATEIGTLHRANHADEIWEDPHWRAVKDVPAHIMRVLQLGRLTGLRLGDLLALDWGIGEPRLDPAVVERMGLKRAKRLGEVGAKGGGTDSTPRIGTPEPFRDLLLSIARSAFSTLTEAAA